MSFFKISGTKQDSHGLELSINKEFIEAQEGKIAVDSVLGIGSTFTVTLKKKQGVISQYLYSILSSIEYCFYLLRNKLNIMKYFDIQETKKLLPFTKLVSAIEKAAIDYAKGTISSPTRLVTPIESGVMLAMPASAPDIAMTKLINICPENPSMGLRTINGELIIWDVNTGIPEYILDAPTVTARRTAAVSMLGVKLLAKKTSIFALYGNGDQASNHTEAIAHLYPNSTLYIIGRNRNNATQYCKERENLPLTLIPATQLPDEVDVVITTTTSPTPVYFDMARPERLVIGVGVFQPEKAEIEASVVRNSLIFVDDIQSALEEAGDILQAGVDWNEVLPLTDAIQTDINLLNTSNRPIFFKSVGCAAWDLAACRVAKRILESKTTD